MNLYNMNDDELTLRPDGMMRLRFPARYIINSDVKLATHSDLKRPQLARASQAE